MTTAPTLRFAFEVHADVAPPERVRHGADTELDFIAVIGGTVVGPRLNGTILPSGGDWTTTRVSAPETTIELDARYLIRADDGTVIDVVNRGFFVADHATNDALLAGEQVPPDRYYFRTQPVFRTEGPAHSWLTHTVFVGVAYDESAHGRIRVEFFEVL